MAFLGALGVASTAAAADIYVNGVKVDFVEPVKVENCAVTFDKYGNIRIEMPKNAALVDSKDDTETAETAPAGSAESHGALFMDKNYSAP